MKQKENNKLIGNLLIIYGFIHIPWMFNAVETKDLWGGMYQVIALLFFIILGVVFQGFESESDELKRIEREKKK